MAEDKPNSNGSVPAWFLAAGVLVVVIPFLPLICSALEHFLAGSNHVEDFFRRVGLHEALGKIYAPLVRLLR